MRNLDNLITPMAVGIIRAAGLHKVAGVMAGIDEMTMPSAVGILGAKSYMRRKTARLVTNGLISLAAATDKTAMTPEAAAHLRRAIAPTKGPV